jgi:dolichyl-diphosphooligosaccharide--protein glycosyltransferase
LTSDKEGKIFTMMVQLLLREPDDPVIAPYFKLIFDNKYARVYEVR